MTLDKKWKGTIYADGQEIAVFSSGDNNDYISLTDIARFKSDEPNDVIRNWMRGKDTLEFLGFWEQLNNSDFKPVEFEGFKMQAGSNAFTMSPRKWISGTNAIGIISRSGRYGGTFAHRDIAFEFASWISAEFKLYIIKDYQRLKLDENSRLSLDWNLNRILAKINYRIHTDAIKEKLIPADISPQQKSITYANEADVLNVALFGQTAKEWRTANPDTKGNIRDEASLQQLIILANLESLNAEFIRQDIPQNERLLRLNISAQQMMRSLLQSASMKKLNALGTAKFPKEN
ncbi:KilA-N domain-containing protein [Desulfitobacterium sp.]|uniref:KilA-N domain-containing protein n=1 Tax=Desulfitobacterium sp. TaxID=49981 RepID=UPI002B1EFDCA|nr:KilA-N domain-containing protein [Desulfitobacterium sp.]MEA4901035.1 KilA-N domain-containing protein [Desulfitobacterium sp.]